jgi:hypothetical protein
VKSCASLQTSFFDSIRNTCFIFLLKCCRCI